MTSVYSAKVFIVLDLLTVTPPSPLLFFPSFLASHDPVLAHRAMQHFTFLENSTARKVTQNPRNLTWSPVSLPTQNSHSSLKANWTTAQFQVSRSKFKHSYQIQTLFGAQKVCLASTSTVEPRAQAPSKRHCKDMKMEINRERTAIKRITNYVSIHPERTYIYFHFWYWVAKLLMLKWKWKERY